MKKLFLTLALVAAGFCGTQAHAEWITKENIGEKLLFYIPNRIVDALDTFSVALGVIISIFKLNTLRRFYA